MKTENIYRKLEDINFSTKKDIEEYLSPRGLESNAYRDEILKVSSLILDAITRSQKEIIDFLESSKDSNVS